MNIIYSQIKESKKGEKTGASKQETTILEPTHAKDVFEYFIEKQDEIKKLKALESYRSRFYADISHELKTPIFLAQGFVHTLLDGAVEDKKVRVKFLEKAAKSLDRMDIIVQDLLTISALESGNLSMKYEVFDMVDLCKGVTDDLISFIEEKEVRLTLKNPQSSIFVKADYNKIYQVMVNLTSNAIRYTKKGEVLISVSEHHKKVRTEIKDTGKGIPRNEIKNIFKRFYRVEKSRSREKGGTGLGLSIVKHILKKHNSRIEVSSTYKKGSVFYFDLNRK